MDVKGFDIPYKVMLIERWIYIAGVVFDAEDAISEEWRPRLENAKWFPKEERDKVADQYLRAIATEIVTKVWGK